MSRSRKSAARVVFPVDPVKTPVARRVLFVLPITLAGLLGAAYVGSTNAGPALRLTQTRGGGEVFAAQVTDLPVDTTPVRSTPQPRAVSPPKTVPATTPRSTPPVRPPAREAAQLVLPPVPVIDLNTSSSNDAPGRLSVSALPWGDVTLDGNPAGTSPLVNLPVTPGQHRLKVTRAGFEPYERTIVVSSGETLRLTDIVLKRRS